MRWISQTMLEAGLHTALVQKGIGHALVYDIIMRDIQSSPSDAKAWHIEATSLMWKSDEKNNIEWSVHRKKLIRKKGFYYRLRNDWGKHHVSTIADNVDTFICKAHQHEGEIHAIEIALGIDGQLPTYQYIRLRNGRVL